MQNDAKCAALAEKEYGSLKNTSNSVMLTIGTGIGGAVFNNGKLLTAGESSGYEFGHIVINKNGKQCSCGVKGCFEAYASISSLKRDVKEKLNLHDEITGKELLDILKRESKNENVKYILKEYIENLAIGIASISNIFEPEVISLGGSIVYYEDILLDNLQLELRKYIFNKNRIPKLRMAILNNDAGMIGATCMYDM